jgi:hypothetical protein
MRKKLGVSMAASALFAGVILVPASAAFAATGTCYLAAGQFCDETTTGSDAVVYNDEDGLLETYVCDTKSDGDSAYDWYNIGSSTHQPTNRQETYTGDGTCTESNVFSTSEITFEAGRDITGGPDNVSGWSHAVATTSA